MRRIVIPQDCIQNNQARLVGSLHHHLCHVLRLGVGAPILMIDGSGQEYPSRITRVTAEEVIATIEECRVSSSQPQSSITLIYGLSRRSRTEWVLQKATELGADSIVLATCARSVSRPEQPSAKLKRWQEIVSQAARQSGRSRLPSISPPLLLETALAQAEGADLRILAQPGSPSLSHLQDILAARPQEIALAVGPEGGFSTEEIEIGKNFGFTLCGLGSLVLRTETAAITFLALIAFLSGRLR